MSGPHDTNAYIYVLLKALLPVCMKYLMNKQMCFFDKNVLVESEFYNYSSVL